MYPTIRLSFHLKVIIVIIPAGCYHCHSSCWKRSRAVIADSDHGEVKKDGVQGWGQEARLPVQDLSLISCVTSDQSLNLPGHSPLNGLMDKAG